MNRSVFNRDLKLQWSPIPQTFNLTQYIEAKSNTTWVTTETGTANPSGAPEFTPGFGF